MQETLAATLTSEVGKPIRQSRNELNGLLGRLDFFLKEAPRTLRNETVLADVEGKLEERISHEPLGVIANVSAWNYPYFVGCERLRARARCRERRSLQAFRASRR